MAFEVGSRTRGYWLYMSMLSAILGFLRVLGLWVICSLFEG